MEDIPSYHALSEKLSRYKTQLQQHVYPTSHEALGHENHLLPGTCMSSSMHRAQRAQFWLKNPWRFYLSDLRNLGVLHDLGKRPFLYDLLFSLLILALVLSTILINDRAYVAYATCTWIGLVLSTRLVLGWLLLKNGVVWRRRASRVAQDLPESALIFRDQPPQGEMSHHAKIALQQHLERLPRGISALVLKRKHLYYLW